MQFNHVTVWALVNRRKFFVQIAWLNAYHRRCEDEVGQYLLDRNKQQAYDWLVARTTPVPLCSASNSVKTPHRVVWLILTSLVTCIMRWR